MRISDADRSRAVDELRRHASAGRLDIDAYAERVAEAMEAETLADLDHALRDLPTMRIADPPSTTGGPGGSDAASGWQRLPAGLVMLLSSAVLLAAVCFMILAHWVWAVILVAGWITGVVQGRVRIGQRRRV